MDKQKPPAKNLLRRTIHWFVTGSWDDFQSWIRVSIWAILSTFGLAILAVVVAVVNHYYDAWGNDIVIGLCAAMLVYLMVLLHRERRYIRGDRRLNHSLMDDSMENADEEKEFNTLLELQKKYPPKMQKLFKADRALSVTAKAMLTWIENHNGESDASISRVWNEHYVIRARCERDLQRLRELGFIKLQSNGLNVATVEGKEYLILLADVAESREIPTQSASDMSGASQRTDPPAS